MIKVLLVDDHGLVRTGIESLLNGYDDISVVGVAGSGEDAVALVGKLKPDVVLMDINMPGIGGIEASRRIVQRHPGVKIIILSIHDDGPLPQQLLKIGVQGYISKSSPKDEMVAAIKSVHSGKRYLCSDVANKLAFSSLPGQPASPFDQLSQREMEVLNLMLQGKSIQDISSALSLSPKTINTYRYRLYEKVGTRNHVELTRMALKFNLIDEVSGRS